MSLRLVYTPEGSCFHTIVSASFFFLFRLSLSNGSSSTSTFSQNSFKEVLIYFTVVTTLHLNIFG